MSNRLPIPGGDDGGWGTILNDFLDVAHNADGTLQTSSLSTAGGELTANKNQLSGYAGLDSSGFVPLALLPANIPIANLNVSGVASGSTYLRGDGTWSTPAGGVTLDPTASDIQPDTVTGSAVAGATGMAADAGHKHPLVSHDHTNTNEGGQIPVGGLSATGTPSSTTYLRGDNTWTTPAAGVTLDSTSSDIQPIGSVSAGSNSQAARADHVHPTTGLVTTSTSAGGDLTGTYPNPTLTGSANVESIIAANSTVAGKASLASPTFTGTPTAPTAAANTNTTQLATTAFTTIAIGALGDTYVSTNVPLPTGNATTDTANIIAAASGSGKVIQFGPGTYVCNAQLTYYAGTRWVGAAEGGTIIHLNTDLYSSGSSPAYFIVPNGGGGFAAGSPWTCENISFTGPGSYSLGQTTCRTTCIQQNSKAELRRCFIEYFYAGTAQWGDHQIISHCTIGNNYYGIDFPDGMPSFGNQTLDTLDLTGNCLASIHISGGGTLDTSVVISTHFGFAPVGIFKTDAQSGWDGSNNPVYAGAASTHSAVTGSNFMGLYMEQIGNAAILDVSTGSAITLGTTIWQNPGMSWGTATYQTTKAPLNNALYQGEWAVYARDISGTTVYGNEDPILAGSVGAWYTNGPGQLTLHLTSVPAALFGSGSSYTSTGLAGSISVVIEAQGVYATLYTSAGTINVGDIVQIVPSTFAHVERYTGTGAILGVALTPGVSSGVCLVQHSGLATINFVGTGQIVGNNVISPNASTPYLADLASANTSMPVLGLATSSGASPTTSLSEILLAGITSTSSLSGTFVQPQAGRTATGPVYLPIFNVLDYGAKGDGSTDDTTSIQSAITAAEAVRGTVYFPATSNPGTTAYMISSSLIVNNQCILSGTDKGSIIRALGSFSSASSAMLLITSTSKVVTEKLMIDAANQSGVLYQHLIAPGGIVVQTVTLGASTTITAASFPGVTNGQYVYVLSGTGTIATGVTVSSSSGGNCVLSSAPLTTGTATVIFVSENSLNHLTERVHCTALSTSVGYSYVNLGAEDSQYIYCTEDANEQPGSSIPSAMWISTPAGAVNVVGGFLGGRWLFNAQQLTLEQVVTGPLQVDNPTGSQTNILNLFGCYVYDYNATGVRYDCINANNNLCNINADGTWFVALNNGQIIKGNIPSGGLLLRAKDCTFFGFPGQNPEYIFQVSGTGGTIILDGGMLNGSPTAWNLLSSTASPNPVTRIDAMPTGAALTIPAAATQVVSAPSVPSTTVAQTNSFKLPVVAYLVAGTASVGVAIDGTTVQTLAANSTGNYTIQPGHTITLTYSSGTPTWNWALL